jgi:hypothetical protein
LIPNDKFLAATFYARIFLLCKGAQATRYLCAIAPRARSKRADSRRLERATAIASMPNTVPANRRCDHRRGLLRRFPARRNRHVRPFSGATFRHVMRPSNRLAVQKNARPKRRRLTKIGTACEVARRASRDMHRHQSRVENFYRELRIMRD